MQLVFLRGFYAKNNSDQFVIFSSTDDLTGRSCPSCRAHEARADSIDGKVNKKNTGKGAPFQVKCTSSESHRKLCKMMVWAYSFMPPFCFFQRRISPTTNAVRGVHRRRPRLLQHENGPFLDRFGR